MLRGFDHVYVLLFLKVNGPYLEQEMRHQNSQLSSNVIFSNNRYNQFKLYLAFKWTIPFIRNSSSLSPSEKTSLFFFHLERRGEFRMLSPFVLTYFFIIQQDIQDHCHTDNQCQCLVGCNCSTQPYTHLDRIDHLPNIEIHCLSEHLGGVS